MIPSTAQAVKPEKQTIAERWDKLLTETKNKVEEEHALEEATPPRIMPIQRELFKEMEEFDSEIVWTINHIVWAFNLPTSYVQPGQEETEYEDAVIRVPLDPKRVDLIPTYSQVQLEDVLDGWMKYLRRTMKSLKDQPLDEFTPMAEYRYWHKMELDLYGTLEQLKTVFVVTVLSRLKEMRSKRLAEWDKTLAQTEERFNLAKENADYLSTIKDYLDVSGGSRGILISVNLQYTYFPNRKYGVMRVSSCQFCSYPMLWLVCVISGPCPVTIVAIPRCRCYSARYRVCFAIRSRVSSISITYFGKSDRRRGLLLP